MIPAPQKHRLAVPVLIVGSLLFAVGRAVLPAPGIDAADIFKDMAHIWIGLLIGMWITLRRPLDATIPHLCGGLILFLIVVELVFAIGGRLIHWQDGTGLPVASEVAAIVTPVGGRSYRIGANGEREYLTDAEEADLERELAPMTEEEFAEFQRQLKESE